VTSVRPLRASPFPTLGERYAHRAVSTGESSCGRWCRPCGAPHGRALGPRHMSSAVAAKGGGLWWLSGWRFPAIDETARSTAIVAALDPGAALSAPAADHSANPTRTAPPA
jgi:hypothetical protein